MRGRRPGVDRRVFWWVLGLALAWPASAQDPVDRRPVVSPPVYPAAPPGLLRLPSSGDPTPLRPPGAPSERPEWHPATTRTVIGIDSHGRVISVQEETPGRFGR